MGRRKRTRKVGCRKRIRQKRRRKTREYVEDDKNTKLLTPTPFKHIRQMDKHNNNNNNRPFRNSWGKTSRFFVFDSSAETAVAPTVAA